MTLGAIVAFLLLLVAAFIFGNLWFHFVEAILGFLKRLFTRRQKPQAWHPLPSDEEERKGRGKPGRKG